MKKKLKILVISLVGILLLGTAGFFVYVSDYYRADDAAVTAMAGDDRIEADGKFSVLHPSVPNGTGLIFYPGGKVEHTAYLPLLQQLQEKGITCVLVEMPFRLAVFSPNAAEEVFNIVPDIEYWYIGGHSLGGAMASSFASQNPYSVDGLILLGAYIYGDVSTDKTLTIYGSEDEVLNREKITYEENVMEIPGGNHAQFGNYGKQKGDGTADISRESQQQQTVEMILEFISA